jgi:hypothetical protein
MKKGTLLEKAFTFVHIVLSVSTGAIFVALVIRSIFSVGDEFFELVSYCVLGIIVFVLFPTSLLFLRRPLPARLKFAPLAVNITMLLVGLLLYFGTSGKMLDFYWNYNGYDEAVRHITLDSIVPDQDGCLTDLPQQYSNLSAYQRVCISRSGDFVTALFETSSEPDGFSRGYLYISQGEPSSYFCSGWAPISGHSDWYWCGAYWIHKHYKDFRPALGQDLMT